MSIDLIDSVQRLNRAFSSWNLDYDSFTRKESSSITLDILVEDAKSKVSKLLDDPDYFFTINRWKKDESTGPGGKRWDRVYFGRRQRGLRGAKSEAIIFIDMISSIIRSDARVDAAGIEIPENLHLLIEDFITYIINIYVKDVSFTTLRPAYLSSDFGSFTRDYGKSDISFTSNSTLDSCIEKKPPLTQPNSKRSDFILIKAYIVKDLLDNSTINYLNDVFKRVPFIGYEFLDPSKILIKNQESTIDLEEGVEFLF